MTEIHFHFNKEQTEKILKKFKLDEISSEFIKSFILSDSSNNPDEEYKILRNAKLKVEIDYKKLQVEYFKIFEDEPSPKAKNALSEKLKNDNSTGFEPPESQVLQQKIKHQWNYFVKEMRAMKDGWKIVCKLCDVGYLGHISKDSAIERLKSHLEESHTEDLIR